MLAVADALRSSSERLQNAAQRWCSRLAHQSGRETTRVRPHLFYEDPVSATEAERNKVSGRCKVEELMAFKTHFESAADVETYFAAQIELWSEPRPQPPDCLWDRMEEARLLNAQLVKARRRNRRNYSAPEFPNLFSTAWGR